MTVTPQETRLRTIFAKLGYNIDSPSDIQKLRETLEWVCKQRERQAKRQVQVQAAGWSVIIVLLGAAATTFGEWLIRKGSGGH